MSDISTTLNERRGQHGDFGTHARLAQDLKRALFAVRARDAFPSPDMPQALEVILDKIARIAAGDPKHTDHWHDIAGYATLVERALKTDAAKSASARGTSPIPPGGSVSAADGAANKLACRRDRAISLAVGPALKMVAETEGVDAVSAYLRNGKVTVCLHRHEGLVAFGD